VACHAVRRAQVVPASSCLVIGAGAVGLLCAAVARFKRCSRIAICDVDERRVNFALQNGFAEIGLVVRRRTATNIQEELENAQSFARDIAALAWPGGRQAGRFSIVFECTGVPSCVQASIYVSSQSLLVISL
jgi:L-iditol 2-dehydrogenase